jgi:phage tail sheath gpL-like
MYPLALLALFLVLAALHRREPVATSAAAALVLLPACSVASDGNASTMLMVALSALVVGYIATGVPSSLKRPGSFHTFLFTNATSGLTPVPQAIAIVGAFNGLATIAVDIPTRVWDATHGDLLCGRGSGAALMLRAAFAQIAKQGGIGPQVWVCGLTPPSGGTAHVETVTITGPATESGNLVIRIAGVTVTVGVTSADTATVVAAALEAQLDSMVAELPVTASVNAGVVTCTYTTKGEVGADVIWQSINVPAGLTVAYAVGAAGAGITDVTNAVDALLATDINAVVLENRKAADVTDAKANTAVAWGYASKKYRHIVLGDPSTLSTADAIAIGANDYTVIVVQCEASPTLGGQLAAAFAARVWGTDRPNANFDNAEIVGAPPPAASVYSTAEVETALTSGTTPLVPNAAGDGLLIVRAVTTKTSTSSAADFAAFDLSTSRTAAEVARQIDIRWLRDFTGPEAVMVIDDDDPEDIRARGKDMIVSVHREFEKLRILRNVDDYLNQIVVEESSSVAGRLDFDDPFRVVSPLHQAAFRHHSHF